VSADLLAWLLVIYGAALFVTALALLSRCRKGDR
jgi:hypothetical protein